MFEGINKYTLELAIDQQKVAQNKIEEVQISFDGKDYKYGSRIFESREQAIWWLKNQKTYPGKIITQIQQERSIYSEKGEKSPLEDLMKFYETYYNQVSELKKDTRKNILKSFSESTPKLELPIVDLLNGQEFLGIDSFALGKKELTVYHDEFQRILPLGDPKVEYHGYSTKELGEFIQQSIGKLGGGEIPQSDAESIASRIVTIRKSGILSGGIGTGFIYNGKIYTNDHVVRGGNIRVFDLSGKEIKNLKYSLPKEHRDNPDVAIIESPDLKQYIGKDAFKMPGTYLFGTAPIHTSISPQESRGIGSGTMIGLLVEKTNIEPLTSTDNKDSKFLYHENGGGVRGSSGSIIIKNGIPIGVNSFGPFESCDERKLYGVVPIGNAIGNTIGMFTGDYRPECTPGTEKSRVKKGGFPGSGGYYIDFDKQ